MIDVHRIAQAVLPLPVDKLRQPRLYVGIRQAIQILVTARQAMIKKRPRPNRADRIWSGNALTALVRSNSLGLYARRTLSRTQVAEVSRWRTRKE